MKFGMNMYLDNLTNLLSLKIVGQWSRSFFRKWAKVHQIVFTERRKSRSS